MANIIEDAVKQANAEYFGREIGIPASIKKPFTETRKQEGFNGSVTYTLTGPEAEVKARVKELFKEFNPLGYGTRATIYPDRTVVWRAGSCD